MSKQEEKELPKDVIIDILTRVPTKHILRFKSVSKTWYTLFQTPSFISKHTLNQTPSQSFLFTPSNINNTIGLITLPETQKPIRIPTELDIPFLKISKPLRVLGTSNGIICLGVLPISSIILLWNPCTRVFKDLPVSRVARPPNWPIKVVLGFGYDEVVKDYKVLRIVYYGYPLSQVEVYSLGTDSWREVKTSVKFLVFESGSSVFLNGAFHWTALGFEEMNGKKLIVGFGLREEVFKYIMPPRFDVGGEKFSWNVVAVKDLLGVIGSTNSGTGKGKRFEVWVMKEYGVVSSWMKYRSFEDGEVVRGSLGCGLNGEVLVEKNNSELVLYDSDSQQIKNIGNHGVAHWSDVFNYVGTLLPIKGGKVVERFNLSNVTPDFDFVRKMDLAIDTIQSHDKRIKQVQCQISPCQTIKITTGINSYTKLQHLSGMNSRNNNPLDPRYWENLDAPYDDGSRARIPISSTFLAPGFTYGVAGSMGPFRLGAHVPSFVLARATSQPLVQNRAHTTTMPRDSLRRARFTSQSTLAADPLLIGDQQCKGLDKLRREIYKPMLRQVSLYYRDYDSRPTSQEKQDNEDGKRCAVCLDDFKPREMVTLTPCNHMFHENCIVPWVKSRGQCPVCRFVISEENKECERTLASNNRELGNDPFTGELISFIRDMEARS